MNLRSFGLVFTAAAGFALGCNETCKDISPGVAFAGFPPATVAAIEKAQTTSGAKTCDASKNSYSRMVFSGSVGSAWKALEEALISQGWKRTSQTGSPDGSEDQLFQVIYDHSSTAKPSDAQPQIHIVFETGSSCVFGDVCVRGTVIRGSVAHLP